MRKSRIGAWATALFLAAALVLPVGTALAAEGDQPGILLGGQGLEGAGKSHVYFGEHDSEPIETRLLAKEGNHLVVLSEYILEHVTFVDPDSPYSNDWASSNAKQWCAEVYSGFTPEEKAAVPATTKSPEADNYSVNGYNFRLCGLAGEHLYFLSAEEVTNPAYGFEDSGAPHESRVAYEKDDKTKTDWWWLRSASSYNPFGAGAVDSDGDVRHGTVNNDWGGRPAFRVNLEAVLFASLAVDGKAGAVGTLGAVGTTPSNDWKLTLKEGTDKRPFAVRNGEGKKVNAGGVLTLDYTGAKTGNKEYVSAMLIDANGKPAYYGRMMAVTQADGEVDVTIPAGLAVGEYSLQMFNEQCNGDKETDYASAASEIPVTVVNQDNVLPGENEGKAEGLPQTSTQGEKITFTAVGAGMDNVAPVMGDERWKPISWSVNPSGDFSNGSYTQNFDTAGMTPGEHKLTITYALERFNGSTWVDTGDNVTQSFPFTLLAAPPQPPQDEEPPAPGETPAEGGAGTPSNLTGSNPGTGDPLTIGWLAAAGVSALGAGVVLRRQRKKA